MLDIFGFGREGRSGIKAETETDDDFRFPLPLPPLPSPRLVRSGDTTVHLVS